MGGRIYTIGGTALAVAVFLALNMFANQRSRGFGSSLTEHKHFTLSEGTRNIVEGLDEPVTLRLYVSRALAARLPSVSGYVARVRDLLEEYEHAAEGRIILTVIDPEPFSEEEDRAVAYGLQVFRFSMASPRSISDWSAPTPSTTRRSSPASSRLNARSSWNTISPR